MDLLTYNARLRPPSHNRDCLSYTFQTTSSRNHALALPGNQWIGCKFGLISYRNLNVKVPGDEQESWTNLTRPDMLNDWNPQLPDNTRTFEPVFSLNPGVSHRQPVLVPLPISHILTAATPGNASTSIITSKSNQHTLAYPTPSRWTTSYRLSPPRQCHRCLCPTTRCAIRSGLFWWQALGTGRKFCLGTSFSCSSTARWRRGGHRVDSKYHF